MDAVLQYLRRFNDYFKTLTLPQKISYAGGVAILIGALGFLLYLNNRIDYAPLYSGLSQSDMGEITQALKAKKIPYRLSEGSIEVARSQLYETRLSLASDGIPKGSGMGFEIFDQQKLGSTEFVQKINYQRALQGELARTINGMSEVLESRVHLVLPEDSLFKEDQKPPSAAVVLKLRPNARIGDKELQGIVHLVAATVRGLDESRITIVSNDGQVMYKKGAEDQNSQTSNVQLERKQRVEDDMRQKVQSMLEQVLGPKRVLARVSVDLDANQVQIAEETYNPDSAVVRSQQRTTETTEGKDAGPAKGNPDVPINIDGKLLQSSPQGGDGAAKPTKQLNRQREVVNYEINKTSRQITQMPGNVKKISVAVIVDGKYENKPGTDGKPKETYVARTPEEMKSMEELVKKAVGYNETRGDQITVSNIPFVSDMGGSEMVKAENRYLQILKSYEKLILNLGLLIAVLLFVVKPFMKKFRQVSDEMKKLPSPAGELEDQMSSMFLDVPLDQLSVRKRSTALVKHDPDKATEIIRQWLRNEV